MADKIILEHNTNRPKELRGVHDIYMPADPPYRREIPVYKPSDRIGDPILKVDPSKIIGVIETFFDDEIKGFTELDETTMKIGENVANFLANEIKVGRIPKTFLPIQSGVGNIANAVLHGIGESKDIPAFEMYTEVIQDSVIGLIQNGNIKFASGSSLTCSKEAMDKVMGDLNFFRDKLVLRPQEISNSPEVVRRIGLIAINTAIECDIFGNMNSTHFYGTKVMNGIGGSGDFLRNSYLSICTTPSTAKGGMISSIVPMVTHLDHSEHSLKVIVSEYGVADLRAKAPIDRAKEIIEKVAHPDYRELLWDYLKLSTKPAHTMQTLDKAFKMHLEFLSSGDMRNTKW